MNFIPEILKIKQILTGKHVEHDASKPLLQLENISVSYEREEVLSKINLMIGRGHRMAVIGPNGAGKSTLLKVIAGLISPTEGKVHIYGSEPSGHVCIAYVPQRNLVDWNFPANVAEVVMMGRVRKIGFLKRAGKNDWQKVHQALDKVGMAGLDHKQINELSGGQQQRVFIARALAQEAELLLLDEPLNGLDMDSREVILNILQSLEGEQVSAIVALHDMKIARERFPEVLLLNRQILGQGKPEEVFNSRALVETYSSHLHFVNDKDGRIALSDECCAADEDDHD